MLAKQPLSQLSYGPILVKPQAPAGTSVPLGFRARGAAAGRPCRTWRFGRLESEQIVVCKWWAWDDSNVRPHPYQGCALTT
jgi:hypothetical protein